MGGHHHHHGHDHHHGTSASKSLLIALVIIFVFAIIELIGGWMANSLALLSDAGHMFADSLSLVLAAVAAWIANRPPSKTHSFGLQRAEVLGALISSLLLILITVVITVEAIARLVHGEKHVDGGMVAIIAFIGLMSNIVVAYILSRSEQNLNIRAAVLHVLGDLLGSIGAIIAGCVIYFTGWTPIDSILSLLICVLIAVATIRLLKETLGVLMEGVPEHVDLNEVGMKMASIASVESVHDLHIWRISSTTTMLSAHINIKNIGLWPICFKSLQQLIKNEFGIEHITLQPEISEIPIIDMR